MTNLDLETMTLKELEAEQLRLFKLIPDVSPFQKWKPEDQDLVERMFRVTDLIETME